MGVAEDAPERATILSHLGYILVLQGKGKEAQAVYDQVDRAIDSWSPPRKETYKLSGARISALYATEQVAAGIAAAEDLVKHESARKGANSFDAAIAHGLLAIGYARSQRQTDALREFQTSIPILISAARENADDEETVVAAKQARLQRIVEAYFNALVDQAKDPNDVAQETFARLRLGGAEGRRRGVCPNSDEGARSASQSCRPSQSPRARSRYGRANPGIQRRRSLELYAALLAPVESGWKSAKNLVVVTNGALGELPLGLLPTENVQVDMQAKPLFAGYRQVPWLARSHSVTVVPSAAAFMTLRSLPSGSPNRENLVGFGDPYFSRDQAALAEGDGVQIAEASEAETEGEVDVVRGRPLKLRAAPQTEKVDKAELAMLPRLPDTREELKAMARALNVDPARSLFLGKEASEKTVESLDLTLFRVIAFATHGLIPGDLDGLTEPALALSAPEVSGGDGDGLLTVDKILALKLDADWVVLSACNTGAGAGAGAEAASGLGSAFFYAGTRALLVTNWSVHSASARELTSDLFRRQSADPGLSRSEALRQSMMALLDGPGAVNAKGQTSYAYAHPLFWAPFTLIGDSGGT